jgi:tetratricopeptide (TPR) repeat protein
MLKPKRKITKQELKQDKLVKTTLQVKTYFEENYKQVSYVVMGVFIVFAIIILYRYFSQKSGDAANAQLGMAQIEFTNSNYERASARLLRLIQDYPGTDAAHQGMFLLANIYFQQQNYKEAKDNYSEFIDSYSGSDILLASGYAGLAACLETENNFAEAAKQYEKAGKIAKEFVESDHYNYLAGICYKKAGEIEKAKERFESLTKDSKASVAKDAEMQLILLQ